MDELDFELVDDSSDQGEEVTTETNEDISDSDDKSKNDKGDDTTPARSNKSNFKKISKLNKALLAENKKLKAMANKKVDANEDEFDDLDDDETVFDKNEFRFFLIENPEAKEYSEEIESILEDYPNLPLKKALALAKSEKPRQSKSTDDFSTKSVNTKVRKRLGDLTDDEALKLDSKKYLEYMRVKGKVK